jgi:hypothetical protein
VALQQAYKVGKINELSRAPGSRVNSCYSNERSSVGELWKLVIGRRFVRVLCDRPHAAATRRPARGPPRRGDRDLRERHVESPDGLQVTGESGRMSRDKSFQGPRRRHLHQAGLPLDAERVRAPAC